MSNSKPTLLKRKWVGLILSTLLFGGLLAIFVDPTTLAQTIGRLNLSEIGVLASLYSATMVLRILRIRYALGERPAPKPLQLIYASVLHQFFNHIIPARLGELSLPYFLHRRCDIPLTKAATVLIAIRFFDLLILLLFGAIALLLLLQSQLEVSINIGLSLFAIGALVAGSILAWIGFVYFLDLKIKSPICEYDRKKLAAYLHRIRGFAARVQEEFRSNWPAAKQATTLCNSILIWLTLLAFFHYFLHFAGYEVTIRQTMIGSAIANLTQLLPINSLGSIGTLEAGWTAGFHLAGLPVEVGVATGLLMHSFVILYLFLITGLFWGMGQLARVKRDSDRREKE